MTDLTEFQIVLIVLSALYVALLIMYFIDKNGDY